MATTRRRGHPMARRMPISFVRSRTLVIIVLSVPIPPIAIATIDVIQAIPAQMGNPGTAAAMLAVQKLVSDILTAGVFAATAHVGGFETVAVTGVVCSLIGAGGLYWADRVNLFADKA